MKINQILPLLLLAFSLAACGNSGPSTAIKIALTDFQFTPNRFTIPAGAEITVTASHNGAVVHDFIIMQYGADIGDMFDEEDRAGILWELAVEPNGTRTAMFIAPDRPGIYQILCGTPGHLQAGMVGELTVVESK
jgi:uncharacterized cupredoxin-like copper-binding protein